jgi:hypothetical protein
VLAQVSISPNATPTLNTGGWVYGAAVLLALSGVVVAAIVVLGYMRFAPRFRREEDGARPVRAPRLRPGRDVPRRAVNVIGSPTVVPAPVAPSPAAAAVAASAPAASAPAPTASAPAPTAAPASVPAAAPAESSAPAEAAPPGPSPAPTPAAQPTAAPATSAGEHKDVALDQETFDAKLAELLAKGTDRRVAEGQARRAAMIAARKKAEG